MLEKAIQDVNPEFIFLGEPISDNRGPLISPAMFKRFMIPVYKRIIATAREFGCDNLLFSTYGDSSLLFPMLVEAGITMLWISEAPEAPGLDYRQIRNRYGADLGLIGGIPLRILRSRSPEVIRNTLKKIVPPLLQSGRYVPLAGGRVREGVSWSNYKAYREGLAELIG
jgi:uroporphyrinogen decarboxylase